MANTRFKLIIGLGNNDEKYTKTYHNVGFLMADYLAKETPSLAVERMSGFMNEAGSSVKEIIKRHNVLPEETLIIHDDSDILLGEYKLSFARGSAGHKGVQNIMDVLKTENFWRLRIGIRPKPKNPPSLRKTELRRAKAEEFVLKNISATNLKILSDVFSRAAERIK